MARARVIVIGSSNTDLVIKLDQLPRAGETRLGGELATVAGGKGANQAVAAARAGGRVVFIGRVGSDSFGKQAMAALRRDGIDVSRVVRDADSQSGAALILVDRKGRNLIAVAPGANARLSPKDVQGAKAVLAGASAVLLQLETPLATVENAAALAARAGACVILNPAPARLLPNRLLRNISILTPNETEAETLTGIAVHDDRSATRAAERLLARGVKTVIITLGARGAFVADGQLRCRVPAIRTTAVDTTAAGDIFNGALAVALGEGRPILEAVRFANAAAAISVTRFGAQPSAPTRQEIDRLLRAK